jgi:hypothetical protein
MKHSQGFVEIESNGGKITFVQLRFVMALPFRGHVPAPGCPLVFVSGTLHKCSEMETSPLSPRAARLRHVASNP